MEPCDQSKGAIDVLIAAVPWVLVIIGWMVVSRDHNHRERRKELRIALSGVTERIRTCERESHEYWMLPGNSEKAVALGVSIKRLLQSIASERARLQAACKMADSSAELIAFRRVTTGGDFESVTRVACEAISDRLQDITECAVDLTDKLEGEFAKFTDRGFQSSLQTAMEWWRKRRSGEAATPR